MQAHTARLAIPREGCLRIISERSEQVTNLLVGRCLWYGRRGKAGAKALKVVDVECNA